MALRSEVRHAIARAHRAKSNTGLLNLLTADMLTRKGTPSATRDRDALGLPAIQLTQRELDAVQAAADIYDNAGCPF